MSAPFTIRTLEEAKNYIKSKSDISDAGIELLVTTLREVGKPLSPKESIVMIAEWVERAIESKDRANKDLLEASEAVLDGFDRPLKDLVPKLMRLRDIVDKVRSK